MSSIRTRHSVFHPYGMRYREYGNTKTIGMDDGMASSLYCGMKPIGSWESETSASVPTGGVFNLEFSPEGSLLVAACEKKAIQIFDPLTYSRIHAINGAHTDCVNCVKFLDNRVFATCSDDTTIGLWDIRNLKRKVLTLHGHANWVKNIEFSAKDNLLVTSGLDGSIFTWDINSYTECSLLYKRVFNAPDLMRCRLSPDARQMVMCTTGGLLIIVHHLDLMELQQDLHGFKPNIYRLMQTSNQDFPIAAAYNQLFENHRKRNRLEFVTDFPAGNDAEVIGSLQIHPQGWTALSRNMSHDDKSEWTCIHDIQSDDALYDKSVTDTTDEPTTSYPQSRRVLLGRRPRRSSLVRRAQSLEEEESAPMEDDEPMLLPHRQRVSPGTLSGAVRLSLEQRSRVSLRSGSERRVWPENTREQGASAGFQIQNDVWEAWVTIRQSRILQAVVNRGHTARSFNMQHITGINTGITTPRRGRHAQVDPEPTPSPIDVNNRPSTSGSTTDNLDSLQKNRVSRKNITLVKQNKDRLMYYIEETNEGRGFMKELCYSSDGRIICSPFGHGMRLLALNNRCEELSHCVDQSKSPKQLVEIGQSLGIHNDLVVSAKFSPRHHLLVTGCLAGKVVWYSPYSGESTTL